VMYHVGAGDPTMLGGTANYTCIRLAGATGATATNAVDLYNNTCYDSGASTQSSSRGTFCLCTWARLRNNIAYQTGSEPYLQPVGADCAKSCTNAVATGSSNNDWFGVSGTPTCTSLTGNLTSNPLFVSTSTPDFHLQTASPMIDAGVTIANLIT